MPEEETKLEEVKQAEIKPAENLLYKIHPEIMAPIKSDVSLESLELLDSVGMLELKGDKLEPLRLYRNTDNCVAVMAEAVFDLTDSELEKLRRSPKKIFITPVLKGYTSFLSLLNR